MALYFLRHGETENNHLKLFTGHDHTPLTEKGKAQAKQAAEDVKKLNISLIISSSLERAYATAEIVAENIGYDKNRIRRDARLAEHDLGVLAGTPWRIVTAEELAKVDGAESAEDFQARIMDFLEEYKDKEGKILIVSHGGVYRMIEATRRGWRPGSFHDVERPLNSACLKLDLGWLDS